MTVLIDTNIFLELFLDQERSNDCEKFLSKVSEGEIEGVITHFSVHAIEVILDNSEAIQVFLRNLQRSIGLEVYSTTLEDEMAASMLMDHIGLDFDDSLQYYVAKKLGSRGHCQLRQALRHRGYS